MINIHQKRIIISKTNQIGDVTFALPVASALKKLDPTCTILFLARAYTKSLVDLYQDVDEFIDWESLNKNPTDTAKKLAQYKADIIIHVHPQKEIARIAKQAGIPIRLGSGRRLFHWNTCNRFINIQRSGSDLHETELDMMFLKKMGDHQKWRAKDIVALRSFKSFEDAHHPFLNYLDSQCFNLILHPKTRGQHIEWSLDHFSKLIELLPASFKIFITGSEEEGKQVRDKLVTPHASRIVDLTGKLTLEQLMAFIAKADGLIAASTGPVHLAANFGINTLGLYAPIRPFHAGRWGPVGEKAEVLCINKNCEACRHCQCQCINEITPEMVQAVLLRWLSERDQRFLPSGEGMASDG